jgi:DNA-binding CsgD family transcriptional regulator
MKQEHRVAEYLSLRQYAIKSNDQLDETGCRLGELDLLHELAAALFSNLQTADLCEEIVQRACRLVNTQNGFIYLANQEEGVLELNVGKGVYAVYTGAKRGKEEPSVSSTVWRTGQALAVNNLENWEGKATDRPYGWDVVRSVLGIPLYSGYEVTAVIGLGFDVNARVFTVKEIDFLSRFAGLASLALHNAQQYNDLKAQLLPEGDNSAHPAAAPQMDLYGQELLLATRQAYLQDGQVDEFADHSTVARNMWKTAQLHLADAYLSADGENAGNSKSQHGQLAALLTERERTVLALMAAGLSNQEIALQIGVKLSTIKTHVNHVFSKLGVKRRVQALVRAREYGLV